MLPRMGDHALHPPPSDAVPRCPGATWTPQNVPRCRLLGELAARKPAISTRTKAPKTQPGAGGEGRSAKADSGRAASSSRVALNPVSYWLDRPLGGPRPAAVALAGRIAAEAGLSAGTLARFLTAEAKGA